ncbi:gluconokinase [Paraoerskovia sediminicola]|uniref:Gluconokinase n=1 Tax=Paraoerskovia sediminicola TaxID=1138587 RepID=A0ABM8G423_9CELL|nr:gluconokinase [Paraoerskovia sediminicola]BDZ42803.1 gluconokinase [Paraoerskovia sediminicola]
MNAPPTHLVLMGVAGSGKSTVAQHVLARVELPFAEADEFHPEANVEKMSAGTPLTDEDRAPWLTAIRDWLSEQADGGRSALVTCSALRRAYRDRLRTAHGHLVFVHLSGERSLLEDRITRRSGHFMKPEMLTSQLDTLERLEDDEDGIVLDVALSPDQITERVLMLLDRDHPDHPDDADSGREGR